MDDRRPGDPGSWSVVSTVRAPDLQIAHFVEQHLALGAERMHLYFDDPSQVWRPGPEHRDRVAATVCTPDWWRQAAARPDLFEHRQLHNVAQARRATSSEWLLHIDVDEYVAADRSVSDCLAELESDVYSVLLPPAEAVYEHEPDSAMHALATPWFRIASGARMQDDLRWLYGESANLAREGLFGHVAGKTFVRVGLDMAAASIHRPHPSDDSLRANLALDGLVLLHFHALDFADWLEKWQRRARGLIRIKAQQAARLTEAFRDAYETGGREAARTLYREWYVPGPERLKRAEATGLVQRLGPLARRMAGSGSHTACGIRCRR